MSKKQQKKTDLGPEFTGGASLVGFEKIVHDLMMSTELVGGKGGYVVSYADTGDPDNKSGLSFGGNQMDMGGDPEARVLFNKILTHAKDCTGKSIFSEGEVAFICGEKNVKLKQILKTPEQVFGVHLERVNAALSSEYGIKKINEAYVSAVKHDIAHIDEAISLMKNPAAKEFYQSDYGKALLYEYNNQYGLTLYGKNASFLNDYINGEINHTKRKEYNSDTEYAAPTDHYGYEDHVKFMHGTKQYDKKPILVDNRLVEANNILYTKYHLYDEHPNVKKEKKLALFEGDEYFSPDTDDSSLSLFANYDPTDIDYSFIDELAKFYSFDDGLLAEFWSLSWLPNYYNSMKGFSYSDFVKTFDDISPFFVADYSLPDFYSESYVFADYDFGQYDFDQYYFDNDSSYNDYVWNPNYLNHNADYNNDYILGNDHSFDNNFNFNYINDFIPDYNSIYNNDFSYVNDFNYNYDYRFNNDYNFFNDYTNDYTFGNDYTWGGNYTSNGGYNYFNNYYFGTAQESEPDLTKRHFKILGLQTKACNISEIVDLDYLEDNCLDILVNSSTAESLTTPCEIVENTLILMNHEPLKSVFYDYQLA